IHTFNAMLSIARLEAGIDSAEWRQTPMGDLAGELAELYEAVAEEDDNLTFISNIRSNPSFHCNRHLIGQAITNLLDNAIKYASRPSQVTLTVDGDSDAFTVSVSDNGPGIPEEERERVFERFVRLENERNSPGNGLGLSLVQAVVRLHSARLTLADNNPGLVVSIHFGPLRKPKPRKSRRRLKRRKKPAIAGALDQTTKAA
ncbi:MAG: sensor histidine kinase, partial [Granulosicoccus sp.]|nr:sensor histidine kinase [Granulosicoccus sp.]